LSCGATSADIRGHSAGKSYRFLFATSADIGGRRGCRGLPNDISRDMRRRMTRMTRMTADVADVAT
jgi:hypothetical protein